MPPKRKASVLASINIEQQNALAVTEANQAVTGSLPSTPKEKQKRAKTPKNIESVDDVLASPSGSMTAEETSVKQGVPPKATKTRKRNADKSATPTTPTTKRKKAAPRKIGTKKSQAIVVDSSNEDGGPKAVQAEQLHSAPLSRAVKHKIHAVKAFLSSHSAPLLPREAGSNVAIVADLDLVAAVVSLLVDFQLPSSTAKGDANEMVVAGDEAGNVSFDFDRTCDVERAVHENIKADAAGANLDTVNFIEVAIAMLVAKRAQLARDGFPAAGFRV